MWIISEFQRRQISVFRPCQRLWLVSLRGASQVGRRRGTFGSSAGLKMTPEQTNLILRKIMLDSKHFHIYTAYCTLKTLKHYTHPVHKNVARGTMDPEIDSVTWIKFSNNMAPLAFVANLATRWRHLQ